MLPVILAWACVSIVDEFKRLIATCMSFSNQFPISPLNFEEEQLKEGLAILCHQAETRMPRFSAAGFFPVDYTMLGMIAATNFLAVNVISPVPSSEFIIGQGKRKPNKQTTTFLHMVALKLKRETEAMEPTHKKDRQLLDRFM
ncbi:hypothetical protein HHI36_000574 [Cryptolaemus montrouzieri]|uniref:Uncharacterized protein n=1 Tax=Cryptolaemus montrouzieri TaxID=559131 RepID=A0ABD2P5Q1_9CUCU